MIINSTQPANYLIVHPERQEIVASGISVTARGRGKWRGRIWVDPMNSSNEDPFVWSDPWLYSFCKATSLKRKPRNRDSYMSTGSTIIFADKDKAKNGTLQIDTIFHVGNVHAWTDMHIPKSLCAKLGASYDDAHARHLKYGTSICPQHKGLYTYSAATVQAHGEIGSFIPIDSSDELVKLSLSELPNTLSDELTSKIKGRMVPIELSNNEISILLKITWNRTVHAVTQLDAVELGELRDEAICCRGCQSKARHRNKPQRCY